ncbi:MAG: 3-dehydroquinate synthase, partial [Geminicoccales bacterium]
MAQRSRAVHAQEATSLHVQRFTVAYEYPVVFTDGLLRPDNPTLVQALTRLEPLRRHRCLVFVDDGICAARPGIEDEITGYAAAHARSIELAAPPIPVPGGERIKGDLWFVEQMQGRLFEHRIDRHSYVIAIGGGAMLD